MQSLEKTDPGIYRALSEITERADGIQIMAFCGVAKLAQGMCESPHDMDLLTDNLPELDVRLAEYRTAPIRVSDNGFFSGRLAKYRIGGVDVDISEGILTKGGRCNFFLGIDSGLVAQAIKFCERPLFIPLEEQLIFDFLRMDKPEKAGLLFGYFKTNRPDFGFLKKRLEVHGIPPDIRMRLLAGLGLHE